MFNALNNMFLILIGSALNLISLRDACFTRMVIHVILATKVKPMLFRIPA